MIAATPLKSGDIRLLFDLERLKEHTERYSDEVSRVLKAQVLKKDYLLEVIGVSISQVPLSFRRGDKNTEIKIEL